MNSSTTSLTISQSAKDASDSAYKRSTNRLSASPRAQDSRVDRARGASPAGGSAGGAPAVEVCRERHEHQQDRDRPGECREHRYAWSVPWARSWAHWCSQEICSRMSPRMSCRSSCGTRLGTSWSAGRPQGEGDDHDQRARPAHVDPRRGAKLRRRPLDCFARDPRAGGDRLRGVRIVASAQRAHRAARISGRARCLRHADGLCREARQERAPRGVSLRVRRAARPRPCVRSQPHRNVVRGSGYRARPVAEGQPVSTRA